MIRNIIKSIYLTFTIIIGGILFFPIMGVGCILIRLFTKKGKEQDIMYASFGAYYGNLIASIGIILSFPIVLPLKIIQKIKGEY